MYFKNVKGLSNSHLETLYLKLNEIARRSRGEVMIHKLTYCVQEFLFEHNKPGKKSCYEEMIIRKEKLKEAEYQSKIHKKTELVIENFIHESHYFF